MSNVTAIVERKPKTVGAKIKGFGDQRVEIRSYADEPDDSLGTGTSLLIQVNGHDTNVAYIRPADLVQALTMLGVIK